MKDCIFWKGLAFVIVVLFIGIAMRPGIATNIPTNNTQEEIDPKEYLFETILEIANNSKVKDLLKDCNYKLIVTDFNHKSIFTKLLLKNPKLFFSIIFTKPTITFEYLETNYNKGLRIVDILGKEESLKLVDSVKTNQDLFYELKNIIAEDEDLSFRMETLAEINLAHLNWDYPIICSILGILFISIFIIGYQSIMIMYKISEFFTYNTIIGKIFSFLYSVDMIFSIILLVILIVGLDEFNCI